MYYKPNQRILVWIAFICLCHKMQAQELVHKLFNREHGLPSVNIYQVLTDNKGFLWACSDNGISKYDGVTFKNYSQSEGFPDFGAIHMLIDKKNRIWFITFSGKLVYLNPVTDKFQLFTEINHVEMADVRWIDEASDGNLFFFTGSGSIFKWKQGTHYERLKVGPYMLTAGCCIGNNEIYTTDNIKIFKVLNLKTVNTYPFSTKVRDYIRMGNAGKNRIITYNEKGIFQLLKDSIKLIFPFDNYSRITLISFFVEDNGDLWICSSKGLFLFRNGIFDKAHFQVFLKDKLCTSICKDFEGNYWVSIFDEGIVYFFSKETRLFTFDNLHTNPNAFLVVGAASYKYAILASGDIYQVSYNQGARYLGKLYAPGGGMIHYGNIINYRNGDVHIFGQYYYYIIKKGKLSQYSYLEKKCQPAGIFNNNAHDDFAYSLQYCDTSLLFEVVDVGVVPACRAKKGMEAIFNPKSMAMDSKKRCWVGCKSGLFYFDNNTDVTSLAEKDNALKAYITDIAVDNKDRVWVATKGNGLVCIDHLNKITHYNTANGLSSNNCGRIFIDDAQDIWVCSNEGLNRVLNQYGKYSKITIYSNLNLLPCNGVNNIKIIDDTAYVATNKGLVIFPKNISVEPFPPPHVYITAQRILGKDTLIEGNLTLHYNQNLAISFIAISYRDKIGLQYRYMLKGLDEQWLYTSFNKLEYTSLPPGDYNFIIQARNSNGIWSTAQAGFPINVIPVYWQTSWFRFCASTAGLLFVSWIIFMWLRSKNKEEQFNRKIAESQLKSLRSQINPHFIFNSINSIQEFIFAHDPRQANLYLTRFASLMRMIIENSKKEFISLKDENDFMRTYLSLEQLRFDNAFGYDICVGADIDENNTYVPPMLIQPLAENAIKHGLSGKKGEKSLNIHFHCKEDMIICTVEDNGIGREQARKYQQTTMTKRSSIGISNIADRLQLLTYKRTNQQIIKILDLHNDDGQATGTRVEIVIPLVTHQTYSL